ncbi:hypothetical protein MXB_4883, partial [Myxobolus squamalis]
MEQINTCFNTFYELLTFNHEMVNKDAQCVLRDLYAHFDKFIEKFNFSAVNFIKKCETMFFALNICNTLIRIQISLQNRLLFVN